MGFACDRAEQFEGIHCVSAAVLDQTNRPVAALVVTGPSYRLPLELLDRLGELARVAGLALSEKLGYVKENTHVE